MGKQLPKVSSMEIEQRPAMLFQSRFPNSPSHDTQLFHVTPDSPLNEVMPGNEHSSDSDTGDVMDPPSENVMGTALIHEKLCGAFFIRSIQFSCHPLVAAYSFTYRLS